MISILKNIFKIFILAVILQSNAFAISNRATIETVDGQTYSLSKVTYEIYEPPKKTSRGCLPGCNNNIYDFVGDFDKDYGFLTIIDSNYVVVYWDQINFIEMQTNYSFRIEIKDGSSSKVLTGRALPGDLKGFTMGAKGAEVRIPLTNIKRIHSTRGHIHRFREVEAIVTLTNGRQFICDWVDYPGNGEFIVRWKKLQLNIYDFHKLVVKKGKISRGILPNGNIFNFDFLGKGGEEEETKSLAMATSYGTIRVLLKKVLDIELKKERYKDVEKGIDRECLFNAKVSDTSGNQYEFSNIRMNNWGRIYGPWELKLNSIQLFNRQEATLYYFWLSYIKRVVRDHLEYRVTLNEDVGFYSGEVIDKESLSERSYLFSRHYISGKVLINDYLLRAHIFLKDFAELEFFDNEESRKCLQRKIDESYKNLPPITVKFHDGRRIEAPYGYIADYGAPWSIGIYTLEQYQLTDKLSGWRMTTRSEQNYEKGDFEKIPVDDISAIKILSDYRIDGGALLELGFNNDTTLIFLMRLFEGTIDAPTWNFNQGVGFLDHLVLPIEEGAIGYYLNEVGSISFHHE